MPLILGTNSIKDTGFDVANSLRFNDGSTDSLERNFDSGGSRKTFTVSVWLKRCELSATNPIWAAAPSSGGQCSLVFDSSDKLQLREFNNTDSEILNLHTDAVFRDPSAWYHIVAAVDTTQSTSTNRAKLYVNGVEQTYSTASYPPQNYDLLMNSTSDSGKFLIANQTYNSPSVTFDGYLAEIVFINNSALDHTSFGEFDSDSPTIWKPIAVTGLTFGTNGFYLNVPGPSTGQNANGLGGDSSGNGNHFASSNLSAVDQSTDTCTNNFATMNPLDNYYASSTFSEGNTKIVTDASAKASNTSTFGISSGKWYCEIKAVQIYNGYAQFGIKGKAPTSTTDGVGDGTDGYAYTASGGNKVNNGSATSYGTVWNNNDIIGIAIDLDNNKLYFSRNGGWQNSGDPTSGSTGTGAAFSLGTPSSGAYYIATSDGDTSGGSANTYEFNFGNPPYSISSGNSDANGHGNFDNAVPSGYFALCTKNLAEFG